MTYAEIDAAYSDAPTASARRRNTQRLVARLDELLGDQLSIETNDEGQRVVRIRLDRLREIAGIPRRGTECAGQGDWRACGLGSAMDAESLRSLATKIRLATPAKGRSKLEVDTDALISSGHVITRHGPSPKIEQEVWTPVIEALTGASLLSYLYPGKAERRLVHPYGIITAIAPISSPVWTNRRGRTPPAGASTGCRMCGSSRACRTGQAISISPPLPARASAPIFNAEEYGEVEWLFSAEVADAVLSYRFHPDQTATRNDDGSVTVRFVASGHLEMAWALYPWGDKVTVIRPERLASLVAAISVRIFPLFPEVVLSAG